MLKYHCDRASCDRVISEEEDLNKSSILLPDGGNEEIALCQSCLKELATFLHDASGNGPYRGTER